MRTPRAGARLVPAVRRVRAGAAVLVSALAAAAAGQDGQARINGVPADASALLRLAAGDRMETGDLPVRLRTAQGEARVGTVTALHHQGSEGSAEFVFVSAGKVEGEIGDRTVLGAAPAWAFAERGGVTRVRIECPSPAFSLSRGSAVFRATAGTVRLRYHAVTGRLPQGHEADLATGVAGAGSYGFRTPPSNREDFSVSRAAGSVEHVILAGPGVGGFLADRPSATQIGCRSAPPGGMLRIECRAAGRPAAAAAIGPGVEAVAEGVSVRVEVPALGDGVLRRLLAIREEFGSIER